MTHPSKALYQTIREALQRESFRKEAEYSARQMDAFLRENHVVQLAEDLPEAQRPNGRFRSDTAAEICRRWLRCLEDAPEEGWTVYCYRYYLSKMFPKKISTHDTEKYAEGRRFLMQILRALYEYERRVLPFDPVWDLRFLSEAEVRSQGWSPDYLRLIDMKDRYYIYEFMRIGADITPYDTLGHIGGVHYVTMFLAEQLRAAGVPIDLAVASGAAACHDLGKYGCRKEEEYRTPYLHYYYTDWCCRANGLTSIAHIAANHSVWDLELENLAVESLVLIYADFRVRSIRTEQGTEQIVFHSLADSFSIILGKLDNVDGAKRERYEKVYAKLSDFEDYMQSLGVRTDLPSDYAETPEGSTEPVGRSGTGNGETVRPALLSDRAAVRQFRRSAFDHSVRLMSRFLDDRDFSSVIEEARSERRWKDLRTYIVLFREYSAYMTERQKLMTLQFLYDLLLNREGDIRAQAAELMGTLIARFNVRFSKEVPKDVVLPQKQVTNQSLFAEYLEKIIHPDRMFTEQFRTWIYWRLSDFVGSVLNTCAPEEQAGYLDLLQPFYESEEAYPEELRIALLKTLSLLDPGGLSAAFRPAAEQFVRQAAASPEQSIHTAAERFGRHFGETRVPVCPTAEEEGTLFLDDLKMGTPWVVKTANIEWMLHRHTDRGDDGGRMHLAMHLANLLKNTDNISVCRAAGDGLLQIAEDMDFSQRIELSVELMNSLKIGDPIIFKYVPEYLARMILLLPPNGFDESVASLENGIRTSDVPTASAMVTAVGIILEHFSEFSERFSEEPAAAGQTRRLHLLGIMMRACAHWDREMSRDAWLELSRCLFVSPVMPLSEKDELFAHCCKKLLVLMDEHVESKLDFYSNAAVLNRIYRFLGMHPPGSDPYPFPQERKICFYPGTFDPFSLGHKAVACRIRDMGFDVYLAIDEFSWSKHTQPKLLRRKILNMSIAGEEGLYPFPDSIPVNIANPADIRKLNTLFEGQTLYLAVGSDVLKHASAYRAVPSDGSVHSMNHIVFEREMQSGPEHEDGMQYGVTGDVIRLTLDRFLEDISSSQIRENVDLGRDISDLMDPAAADFIYNNGLYLREPAYKHVLESRELEITELRPRGAAVLASLTDRLADSDYNLEHVGIHLERTGIYSMCLKNRAQDDNVIACAAVHRANSRSLRQEFGSSEAAAYIRRAAEGPVAVIGFFYADEEAGIANAGQILLTEVLARLIHDGCVYAVYQPVDPAGYNPEVLSLLEQQGFVNIAPDGMDHPIPAVSMKTPSVIFRDVETVLKAPFNQNPQVIKALDTAHRNLLDVLRKAYPGELLLSFNMSAVHHKIIQKVAEINDVSASEDKSRSLGPYMSVPFGKVLGDVLVPNTVTKPLSIEKYYSRTVKGFSIAEARNFSTVEDQVKTIRSFSRPVILIDDLLQKCFRIKGLLPSLKKEGVEIRELLVGVMTGQARDKMADYGIPAEGIYDLPELKIWLDERDCYPFIGGDSIAAADRGTSERSPSVNLVLPYVNPEFVSRCSETPDIAFLYSLTCLRNAVQIMQTLQDVYQETYERKLTLQRLGEVFTETRIPDIDVGVRFDGNMAPVRFLQNDVERLIRQRWGEYREETH